MIKKNKKQKSSAFLLTDPCTEGEELPASGTSSADCVKCPVGTYKSSADTTCQQCETGYTTVDEGSKAAEDCLRNYFSVFIVVKILVM